MVNKLLQINQPRETAMSSFEKKSLIKKIQATTKLPSLDLTITKLIKLLRQEEVIITEIVELTEKDQALVAQILRIINSGFYGLKQKVDSVGHAINLLGLQNIKNLVYGVSVMNFFGEDQKAEWEHSYTSSLLMERIIKECGIKSNVSADLPVAMLLHDIGKLILRKFNPKKYKMAAGNAAQNPNMSLSRSEEQFLHINHAEAATILMEKWEIDDSIAIPIQWHHNVDELPPDEFILETALVQIVNWVDNRVREIYIEEPSKKLLTSAGIDEIDKLYWVSSHRKALIEMAKAGRQ